MIFDALALFHRAAFLSLNFLPYGFRLIDLSIPISWLDRLPIESVRDIFRRVPRHLSAGVFY